MNKAAIPIQSNRKKNHRIYHRKIIILEDNFLFGKAAGGAIIKYFNLHDTMLYQSVIIGNNIKSKHTLQSLCSVICIFCAFIFSSLFMFFILYINDIYQIHGYAPMVIISKQYMLLSVIFMTR